MSSPEPAANDNSVKTPGSLRWTFPAALDDRVRALLRLELEAVISDTDTPEPGWNKLCPDVVVVASGDDSGFRLIAHWLAPMDGMRPTSSMFVQTQVARAMDEILGYCPEPQQVTPGH
jgi:hypothetical protein